VLLLLQGRLLHCYKAGHDYLAAINHDQGDLQHVESKLRHMERVQFSYITRLIADWQQASASQHYQSNSIRWIAMALEMALDV
jgi:hypothetical protein